MSSLPDLSLPAKPKPKATSRSSEGHPVNLDLPPRPQTGRSRASDTRIGYSVAGASSSTTSATSYQSLPNPPSGTLPPRPPTPSNQHYTSHSFPHHSSANSSFPPYTPSSWQYGAPALPIATTGSHNLLPPVTSSLTAPAKPAESGRNRKGKGARHRHMVKMREKRREKKKEERQQQAESAASPQHGSKGATPDREPSEPQSSHSASPNMSHEKLESAASPQHGSQGATPDQAPSEPQGSHSASPNTSHENLEPVANPQPAPSQPSLAQPSTSQPSPAQPSTSQPSAPDEARGLVDRLIQHGTAVLDDEMLDRICALPLVVEMLQKYLEVDDDEASWGDLMSLDEVDKQMNAFLVLEKIRMHN
ncbi:hypothetical protein F4819DRAFT_488347 [Hypoxylon fuscum]|nr:hypothetical protein F4819DRAFT_488347 [Hypoxylon fuscum]